MNRKLKRIIQNKLGADFPLDKFAFLCDALELDADDCVLYLLRKYIPYEYNIQVEVTEIHEAADCLHLFSMRNHIT